MGEDMLILILLLAFQCSGKTLCHFINFIHAYL